jgi:hypothetical protein
MDRAGVRACELALIKGVALSVAMLTFVAVGFLHHYTTRPWHPECEGPGAFHTRPGIHRLPPVSPPIFYSTSPSTSHSQPIQETRLRPHLPLRIPPRPRRGRRAGRHRQPLVRKPSHPERVRHRRPPQHHHERARPRARPAAAPVQGRHRGPTNGPARPQAQRRRLHPPDAQLVHAAHQPPQRGPRARERGEQAQVQEEQDGDDAEEGGQREGEGEREEEG